MDNTPIKKYEPRDAKLSNILINTARYENAQGFVKLFYRLINWRQIQKAKDLKIN